MKILIVDDEHLARRGVRVCLRSVKDAVILGECATGEEAVQCIAQLKPDIVFLDVQLPGMTGFEVLERISAEHAPLIIFLTAYDQHAVEAFSVHAIDYLLKPIHDGRFAEAMTRARQCLEDLEARALMGRIRLLMAEQANVTRKGYIDRIPVKNGSRTHFVDVVDIAWIGASGDYAALHVRGATHLVRETLDELDRQLDPSMFARIHRSTIVSVRQIASLKSLSTRDVLVQLRDGTNLRGSRRYRQRLFPK